MKLFHLVYCSRVLREWTQEELEALLAQSRERNGKEGITGLLVYHPERGFVQALEGREANVLAVYGSIQRDERHRSVTTVLRGDIAEREFGNWAMAFRRTDEGTPVREGYSDFLNDSSAGKEFPGGPEECQRLLLFFKKFLT